MLAPVDICNLALAHLAVGTPIASLETEKSQEAAACRLVYPQTRDEVLRDFPWPFATRTTALALVAEQPTSEWGYSYRVPAGCLAVRRILSGMGRVDSHATRVVYKLASDDAGDLICTDQPDAEAEWTARIEDANRYPPDFVQALAFLLASYLAPRLTGGDQFRLGQRAREHYEWAIRRAQANAANEEQPDRPPESEFITGRW